MAVVSGACRPFRAAKKVDSGACGLMTMGVTPP